MIDNHESSHGDVDRSKRRCERTSGQVLDTQASWWRKHKGRLLLLFLLACFDGFYGVPNVVGQDQAAAYSDEIVAKAEAKLLENGLRRAGDQIQLAAQAEFAKLVSDEGKASRQLKQLKVVHDENERLVLVAKSQLEMLESQLQLWNTQYAAEGNVGGRNNALVARINAGTLQQKQFARQRDLCLEAASMSRSELNEAEASYAELVLKMRSWLRSKDEAVRAAALVPDVRIALQVLGTRYKVPAELSVADIIDPLDRRVRKFEELVFDETIPLEAERGGLFVRATIGLEPVSMMVDSGATLVVIPADVGEKLGIQPEANAKGLRMVTADGRRIEAKEVVLPRIRVGQFVAENVPAALLAESVPGARPLLGLSFLEKFRFQIDPVQKQLSLLRIEEPKSKS